jgi:hypothetical protein
MPTMHQPVKGDKVWSLCLFQDVSRDRPETRGLQSFQITVQLNCNLAHKDRLRDAGPQGQTRDVIHNGIVPPGQSFLVQCVFTMNKNMEQRLVCHVPTELAIDSSMLPTPSQVSEGGQCVQIVHATIQGKFQDTARKVTNVRLPHDAFTLSLQQSRTVSPHTMLDIIFKLHYLLNE